MSEVVAYTREGNVGVISVNYPPVNALSHAVRAGLVSAWSRARRMQKQISSCWYVKAVRSLLARTSANLANLCRSRASPM